VSRVPRCSACGVAAFSGAVVAGGPAGRQHRSCRDDPGIKLALYPDGGHAFLFQHEHVFVALVEKFLG
jgi:hypothetical protein